MTTIQERTQYLIDTFYSKNLSKMARELDIKQSTLKDIVGVRKNNPSLETIIKILYNTDLNINRDWYLLGIGEAKNDNHNTGDSDRNSINQNLIREMEFAEKLIAQMERTIKDQDAKIATLESKKRNVTDAEVAESTLSA